MNKSTNEKAEELANMGCVKVHRFLPSDVAILTVVGKEREEVIDPEKEVCTCKDFFYRISRHGGSKCVHLSAYLIAREKQLIDVINFDDRELVSFISALYLDLRNSTK